MPELVLGRTPVPYFCSVCLLLASGLRCYHERACDDRELDSVEEESLQMSRRGRRGGGVCCVKVAPAARVRSFWSGKGLLRIAND